MLRIVEMCQMLQMRCQILARLQNLLVFWIYALLDFWDPAWEQRKAPLQTQQIPKFRRKMNDLDVMINLSIFQKR